KEGGIHLFRKPLKREGLLDFCGNDYLGLKTHPAVIEEARKVLEAYGLGSGASQLVSGYTEEHEKLRGSSADLRRLRHVSPSEAVTWQTWGNSCDSRGRGPDTE
ncbi:MAG: hypothetical protein Q9N34_06390, partial [Aquificota bacterium]|nr:hypothetical protein [Aquificota bacterium]